MDNLQLEKEIKDTCVDKFEEEITVLTDAYGNRLTDLESKDRYLTSMIKGVEIDFACHIAKLQNEIKRLDISLLILFLVNFVLFFLLAINYGGAL